VPLTSYSLSRSITNDWWSRVGSRQHSAHCMLPAHCSIFCCPALRCIRWWADQLHKKVESSSPQHQTPTAEEQDVHGRWVVGFALAAIVSSTATIRPGPPSWTGLFGRSQEHKSRMKHHQSVTLLWSTLNYTKQLTVMLKHRVICTNASDVKVCICIMSALDIQTPVCNAILHMHLVL